MTEPRFCEAAKQRLRCLAGPPLPTLTGRRPRASASGLITRVCVDWVRVLFATAKGRRYRGDAPSHVQYTRAGSSFSSATASMRLGWALWITHASVMWSRR